MRQVFISYCKHDCDFAEIVQTRLQEEGIKVWRDAGLHAGDDWRSGIDKELKESDAIIVIMSPEAKASDYVTYEWAFALGAGKKVVPLLLKATNLHPRLDSLHYLDFTNARARPWSELIDQLKGSTPEVKLVVEQNKDDLASVIRMVRKLREEGYKWRKVDTLAKAAFISSVRAIQLLMPYSGVAFSKNENGEDLVRVANWDGDLSSLANQ